MKRKISLTLITIFMVLLCICGIACAQPSEGPQKLSAPVVNLTSNVASWQSNSNADRFEISIDGGLSYVENTVTSKVLTDGQTIKVRAIGDGIKYTTSDWSNSVTYTQGGVTPQPTKLATPTVSVSSTGLASWNFIANASGYKYKINGGVETVINALSLQLTNGQSITVKAIGDGNNYTDSDYSAPVTYTAQVNPDPGTNPDPQPTTAPTYLGIAVSDLEPSQSDVPSGLSAVSYAINSVSIEDAIKAYLQNGDNAMGESAPTASSYELYSSVGRTVYVQIWLNNPDQNTILSLKLNNVKYQTGGDLKSFFVQSGNSYLNCVYVAITIPEKSYGEISYEVTEIEYVEGNNVSQNGKAVLIDENNDTVLIGLPYEQAIPSITVSNVNSTATAISFNANVTDEDAFMDLIDGWLRVVIYNRNNEVLSQQKLTSGNNEVTFNNLSADTYYNVMAFIYGDTHDGNGVAVHTLNNQSCKTESVITVNITSDILKNEQTDKYYPVINVTAELGDTSFAFTKVEVCEWNYDIYGWKVLYTGDFDGSKNITEGILNGQSYTVKVYYENASGVEQSYESDVYVERLDYPWVLEPCLQYGLVDDAVLGFDFGDNKSNFDNLTIRIIDEYSKQYLAENAIYLIDNPNAIAELEAQWQNYGEGWQEIYDRWHKLDQAQDKINDYYPDVEKAEWQAELAKGIYTYELVYGQDDEFFKVGNKYYVILDSYQSQRVNDYSWKYTLLADFDLNNGEGVEEDRLIDDGWFDINPAIGENDYLFEEEFTLDDENVVYLEVKSRNNLGGESYRELGYVNQIVLADGYDIYYVLWKQDEPEHAIDETAWMENVINALKANEDVNTVFPLGEMEPITFDLDDIEFPSDLVGNFDIRFTYIMYGKTYTQEKPYTWDGSTIAYTVIGQLPQASVSINTKPVEDYGSYDIIIPDQVENGRWHYYSIEVKDGDGNLVGTYNQDNRIDRLQPNYSIRIKLDADPYVDYYMEGEWSEWFVCERGKLNAPTQFSQSYNVDGVTVEWNGVDNAEKYVYVVNNGEETETSETSVSKLKNGDTVKVKVVPASNSIFAESVYSEIYTVNDTRTQLSAPANIRFGNKMIMWNAVENATYYNIEFIRDGTPYSVRVDYTEYHATVGLTYRVRACNDDVENYLASEWSGNYQYSVTLEVPTFNRIRSERVYWNSVENAGGYNYKIGINGDVVDNGRTIYVPLSSVPVGEKLYVQAYADGCDNSEWAMIYHNVTVLTTPEVTVSGGTASWIAIENATGYVYKINGGAEQTTVLTEVSGLVGGDRIVVRATSTQAGYADSEWSEEKTQAHTMGVPELNTELFASEGIISWSEVEGATAYEYDIDGNANTVLETSVSNIEFGQSFKVRAVCDSGEYEQYGEWSEVVIREDTREQLATPVIAYDPEIGLTVEVNDPNISYELMFGQDGPKMIIPSGEIGTQVLTTTFAFPGDDYTVYVRAIVDNDSYRESEWASVKVFF